MPPSDKPNHQSTLGLPLAVERWIFRPDVEGGFGNDPDDAGGETKYGISQKAYPDENIRELTPGRAAFLYHRDYWRPIRGDELPIVLAVALFDSAVNSGVSGSIVRFQLALNKLGLGPVKSDGLMGPQTIRAAKLAAEAAQGRALAEIMSFRAIHYAQIAAFKPSQERFLRGWMKRTYLLMAYCLSLTGTP